VTLLAVLALGFVLGLRHATDADHVMAVTTLVSRERSPRAAIALGALWGLGHSLTLLVVGGTIVVFGLVVPPRLGLSMEFSVAVMLIVLGTLNLTGAGERLRQGTSHAHTHAKDDSDTWTATALGVLRRGSRSVLIGVVHGLAGSAAVALLVLTTLDKASWALTYLGVFGIGTVAGMMLITATMALPIKLAMERFASAERVMARATGALSLAFGIFLAYRIGFVDGLLLAEPKWTPE
jgi:high-affinity nickel-transport protein